jgi:AcrR family transcriptional regulator
MPKRVSRAERTQLNREQVLAAARKVFIESGYERATLDAIAEAAGFSKGVVYSQFESKGDLFLALLERRIDERAAQNEAVAKRSRGLDGLRALIRTGRQDREEQEGWALVLLEFRLHAARDPALNERYAAAHERTLAGVAAVIERLAVESELTLPESPRHLAALVLAMGPGLLLEQLADPRALPNAVTERAFLRLFGAVEE